MLGIYVTPWEYEEPNRSSKKTRLGDIRKSKRIPTL